jgi:hypothetical protein
MNGSINYLDRPWNVERTGGLDDDPDLYVVKNNITGEKHTALSYKSAHFLENLFNNQHVWYTYDRHGMSPYVTSASNGSLKFQYDSTYPKANWKYSFGDSPDVYFQFYLKKPPNRVQRWMYRLVFGVKWEKIE